MATGDWKMTEHCCDMLRAAVDGDAILSQPMFQMHGRILNEINSDYAVRSPEERPNLFPINFCPFCGRAVSRTAVSYTHLTLPTNREV